MTHGHNHDHSHHHPPEEKKALQIRLRKVVGQLKAIEGMVAADADCCDVLPQVVSVRRALKSFAEVVIQQHTKSCIAGAADPHEGQRRLNELLKVLKRYIE